MRKLLSDRFHFSIWLGPLIGFLLSAVLMYISFIAAIHDELRTAAYLFPIPVLLNPDMHSLNREIIFLAFIQWPLYGLAMGLALRRLTKPLVLLVLTCLIVQHGLIGIVARARVESLPVRMKLERDLPAER